MKYYRTYITTFETSSGLKVYAGKHESKYKDPREDPYYGSGNVIRRAVKKYGRDCIKSIDWFDHETKEEMVDAEIGLVSECKSEYGKGCVNIAKGGAGGYTLEFATDEQKADVAVKISIGWHSKPEEEKTALIEKRRVDTTNAHMNRTAEQKAEISDKISISAIKRFEVMSDADKLEYSHMLTVAHSNRSKENKDTAIANFIESMRNRTDEEKEATANKKRLTYQNKTDEEKAEFSARQRAASEKSHRKAPIWHDPLYSVLWQTWLELNRPTYRKFESYCRRNDITTLSLMSIVRHFNVRYNEKELKRATGEV